MEDWDLRAFIFGCDDLDEPEKKLCYEALNREGFSAANKRRAFFALDEGDLSSLGITLLSTRKVLLLAITGASTSAPATEHLRGQHASADAQPPITMAALKEALEGQAATMKQALEATLKEALPDNRAARHFPVSTVDWNLLEQSWVAYLTEVPTKKKVS